MPVTWRDLLEELAPEFRRRSTHALFMALACGMILAGGRRTVVALAAAAGMARQWRRACWFFSHASWDIDDLGLAAARLIVKYLRRPRGQGWALGGRRRPGQRGSQ
ncbi:MAG: transposase [Streptosporangiaceae bacterium]